MSAASATTPSSRMWRDSSASASSTAVVELVDGPRRVLDDHDVAALGEALERLREREAVGPGVVQLVPHVVRDLRADQLEEDGRRHRQAHPQDGLVGLLDRVAVVERLRDHRALAAEQPVDDERGRVLDEDAGLAELLRDRPGGRERRVVGLPACARARRAAAPRPG